jgi:hypothetical protein
MRNISRSPSWSSWSISFLISYTLNKEYEQKSSVEFLVYSLTDFVFFKAKYESKSFVELLVYFNTDSIIFYKGI